MSEAVELLTLWERGVILTFNTCRLGFVNFCWSFFFFFAETSRGVKWFKPLWKEMLYPMSNTWTKRSRIQEREGLAAGFFGDELKTWSLKGWSEFCLVSLLFRFVQSSLFRVWRSCGAKQVSIGGAWKLRGCWTASIFSVEPLSCLVDHLFRYVCERWFSFELCIVSWFLRKLELANIPGAIL